MQKIIKKIIKTEFVFILAVVTVWAIGIYAISYWGSKIILVPGDAPNSIYTSRFAIIDHWYWFDAGFYLGIDTTGYKDTPPPDSPWGKNYVRAAFFPAFPLVGKILSYPLKFLSCDLKQALLITNFLFTVGASYFIYKFAYLFKKDKEYAFKTLVYFLIFPFSFFLLAPYSEASFVFFSAAIFYFLFQRKYLFAALMGIGATAARFSGIIFPLIILLFYLEDNNWRVKKINYKIVLYSLIPLSGIIAYMIYQKFVFNDYFYFFKMQQIWRSQMGINFIRALWHHLKEVFSYQGFNYNNINEIGSTVLFFILGIMSWVKIKYKTLAIFIFISLLIPLTTGAFVSINRIVVPIIPAFLVLGLGYGNKIFDFAYMTLAILFLALFTILFTHAIWVG